LSPDCDRAAGAPAVPAEREAVPEPKAVVIDWTAVLSDLDRGDPVAIAKVSRVISAFLNRYRAYELRDSWEDLRQEVLEILIRSHRRGVLRHPGAFVSYTGRIVWSRLALRTRRKDRPSEPRLETPPLLDPDLALDLERALTALSERERSVVDAVYLRGMNYQAAADELKLPLGTLKRLQTGALRALRESLGVVRKARGKAETPARVGASRGGEENPS
jgi:RNA polymerase sigma factor (sigma-70 family)